MRGGGERENEGEGEGVGGKKNKKLTRGSIQRIYRRGAGRGGAHPREPVEAEKNGVDTGSIAARVRPRAC